MDDDLTPAFRQGRDSMIALRLEGARTTSYEELIEIQKHMGLTFKEMDKALGLNSGSFLNWVATAPRKGPKLG